ncbi:carboxylesterase/lipase family protein [Sphingomonas sp.]|uniref:carboxylesterase/lipase family protein n=1 Tax=Sphingomonas sp. TaxID=28214 RepID=UPI0035C7C2BD
MRRSTLMLAILLATTAASAQMPPKVNPVTVQSAAGTLQGDDQDDVLVFRGVPYAAPPIGPLRWSAPRPVAAWKGVRTAVAHEPPCPQPVMPDFTSANPGGVNGAQSEDCLYLEVYAPEAVKKAPVLVWFHGGAFFLGAGHLPSYEGRANARQGVITVDVNYRLGALANFNHPALDRGPGPHGNYALQDAVAALRWVRDNITAFGGDPDNVTVAGQSAGGGIVTGLLSLPAAKGLFGKAIIQSGALLRPDITPEESTEKTLAGLKDIDVGPDATPESLRQISAQTFVGTPSLMRGTFFVKDSAYKPVSTIEALTAGTETDVPLLIGSNSGEGGFAAARRFAEMAGDQGAPAWLYRFAHTPAWRAPEWKAGPIHSAELMFTFDTIDQSSWGGDRADATDRTLARVMNGCWTAFVRMAPGSRRLRCGNGFEWKPYGKAGEVAEFRSTGPVIIDARALPDGPPK